MCEILAQQQWMKEYSNCKYYIKSILIILLPRKISTTLHCSHNTNYADCQNYQNALYILTVLFILIQETLDRTLGGLLELAIADFHKSDTLV